MDVYVNIERKELNRVSTQQNIKPVNTCSLAYALNLLHNSAMQGTTSEAGMVIDDLVSWAEKVPRDMIIRYGPIMATRSKCGDGSPRLG